MAIKCIVIFIEKEGTINNYTNITSINLGPVEQTRIYGDHSYMAVCVQAQPLRWRLVVSMYKMIRFCRISTYVSFGGWIYVGALS